MKKIYLFVISAFLFLIGCTKPDFKNNNELIEAPITGSEPGDNANLESRTYASFQNLTQLPNGHFTDGHIWFDQIVYRTGEYPDGEGVSSINFYFDPVVTPNVLWSSSEGPVFIYVQGTPIGGAYTPSFIDAWYNFRHALHDFLDDTPDSSGTVFPNLDDYLPNSGSNGELITKGIVVRRHNSPSTFAIAPSTFQPVAVGGGEPFTLGYVEQGNYIVYVNVLIGYGGLPASGSVYSIDVYTSGYQPVTINGFVGTYTERQSPATGYDVVGEFTLPNNTIVSFSGVADGI